MSDQGANPPRVAIKLGAPSSSTAAKKHTRPAHVRRHRAHALQHAESGSSGGETDDDRQGSGRHEAITDINFGGSSRDHDRRKKHDGRPDNRSDSRRDGKDERQTRGRNEGAEATNADVVENKPVKWGLTINMKGTGGVRAGRNSKDKKEIEPHSEPENGKLSSTKRTIEDDALDALVGAKPSTNRQLESDAALDRDPRPEDYRSVPIDDFGATLLKSFGWDGKLRGKVKEPSLKHANLAGLGAKDVMGAEDLGSWNQKPGGAKDSQPQRLEDYRREESKKRQRIEYKYGPSYKREREREREREQDHHGRDWDRG
ncbi:hypothetical protein B0H66DRAFT_360390 [Apodospora peruviana]|uniref:Spp2/MOS2 G-patch domain-containing protein n=1 Tax=Apodospora peruviana TaxID=516989 RepID=A0AAE0LZQ9_9PEZI|nr:hypothetical protein B0H66DRAFT_360390 [Apodospora peruviana]